MAVDAVDDLAVHLDEPPVGVVREARVARRLGQPFDRHVVQPEVEDRVHHPRHRDRGAAANRDEQRVVQVAEALPGPLLERGEMPVHLVVQPLRDVPADGHVRTAGVGRDREPAGDGNAELRHLGEADALAAEKLAPSPRVFVEVVDVAHLRGESTHQALLARRSGDASVASTRRLPADQRRAARDLSSAAHAAALRPSQIGVSST